MANENQTTTETTTEPVVTQTITPPAETVTTAPPLFNTSQAL